MELQECLIINSNNKIYYKNKTYLNYKNKCLTITAAHFYKKVYPTYRTW